MRAEVMRPTTCPLPAVACGDAWRIAVPVQTKPALALPPAPSGAAQAPKPSAGGIWAPLSAMAKSAAFGIAVAAVAIGIAAGTGSAQTISATPDTHRGATRIERNTGRETRPPP